MLGRLVERGAVVRQSRGRKRLYAAAEPLYSMYYKLRRERDEAAVVENLIRFMVACYGVDDLWKLSGPLSVAAALAVFAGDESAVRLGDRHMAATNLTLRPCSGDADHRFRQHGVARAQY